MEPEVAPEVNTTDDFWAQVETVLSKECPAHDDIDDALRSYLAILEAHHERYITTDDHLGHCTYLLYTSNLFANHATYVRQQFIHCLLQEDNVNILRIAATFLLADARENEQTFNLLNKEGAFPRLVELIDDPRQNEESLHRTYMELLYEMSRIQKITNDDLTCINDQFVCRLFDIIEEVSDDVTDPYHYPVIRVLLVLNEQFMMAAQDPALLSKKSMPLTNKVVKVLSSHGSRYKTFGANIILLLNREDETSLQLLTLKLMYLLFTTPPTHEYFYTNDLKVLVDILVRNLLDLPEYAAALRHTYLRVLYPLLEHTQLQYPPYYKREEIKRLLALLCGHRVDTNGTDPLEGTAWNYFEDVDETTKRLVSRCQSVSWLIDPEPIATTHVESPIDDQSPTTGSPTSPLSPTKPVPPQLPAPRKLRKRDSSKESTLTIGGYLAPHLVGARQSSISMAEMAQQKERPGVITPSRNPSTKNGLRQAIFAKKEKPPPPKARRSGSLRPLPQTGSSEAETAMPDVSAPHQHTEPQAVVEDKGGAQASQELKVEKHGLKVETTAIQTKPAISTGEVKLQSKKPPPAPKARRGWRMRKSKDLDQDGYEPGKFSTIMPSVSANSMRNPFSPPTDGVPDHSPFSPAKDKTLDPLDDGPNRNGEPEKKSRHRRSVGAAMIQAQAQATRQVEESLESTHIGELRPEPTSPRQTRPPRTSSLQQSAPKPPCTAERESPSLQRTVLAPPGQAPARSVPGPRVEVEKSPFLSDEEREKEAAITEPSRLSRRESWEDFDNEE